MPLGTGSRVAVATVTAGFVVTASAWATANIQDDLTARGQAALTTAGIPVTVRYEGRDAVLSGSVGDPRQAADAIGTISRISGTRRVRSGIRVTGTGDPGSTADPGGASASPDPVGPAGTEPGGDGVGSPTAVPGSDIPGFPAGAITFATNDATLSAAVTRYLDRVARYLREHPRAVLVARGHSDNTGPDEVNWTLSRQRAAAVVNYLTGRGIPIGRLRIAAFAATSPVASNDTEAGRAANRRVELVIEGAD